MLRIRTLGQLALAGDSMQAGQSRLALMQTDRLLELDAPRRENHVRAERHGQYTDFRIEAHSLDLAPYGLFRTLGSNGKAQYRRSATLWLPVGITRLSFGDFEAYIAAGPRSAKRHRGGMRIEGGNLLALQLFHTPYGAVVQVGPHTRRLFPGLPVPRCLFNPLNPDGSEFLIGIAQSCTFAWLFTDTDRTLLLYGAERHYADAAQQAHRLSMVRGEGNRERDFQAALQHLREGGSQHAPSAV